MKIHSYKLQNNEVRFKFHIYIGTNPLTGKEKTTTRSGFKTKKEAKDAYLSLQQEIKTVRMAKLLKTHMANFTTYGWKTMKIPLKKVHF
ncbi:Arm DNA-binding domain-containing protein [Kurthia sp. Dielmo]|uniref:Arm DNA-binding domain-containing protein n=1 Tax=Kurthia sp. Dielmo TaxID=1033738 RepID=UPI001C96A34E|nr:Arm DNA-binding domain-containing protein [Kurthia sp. Dielmo]